MPLPYQREQPLAQMTADSEALSFLRRFETRNAECLVCRQSGPQVTYCVLSNTKLPYGSCKKCLPTGARNHPRTVQIRRASRDDVVAADALSQSVCLDVSDIQTFKANSVDVIFLRRRPFKTILPAASTCQRCDKPLDTAGCSFCSLQCKLEAPAQALAAASLAPTGGWTSYTDCPSPKHMYGLSFPASSPPGNCSAYDASCYECASS